MTLKRSKITGCFCAQCDGCLDIMDFEPDDTFFVAINTLRLSDWRSSKVDDKWTNKCPDCVKKEQSQ